MSEYSNDKANETMTTQMEKELNFFISDKLRGIPLVSKRNQFESTTTTIKPKITTTMRATSTKSPFLADLVPKPIQVGKREAANLDLRPSRAQDQAEILFRASGVTASTANLIRSTKQNDKIPKTTTTRRPKTTTTRRPVKTTTTASKPKELKNTPKTLAKLIVESAVPTRTREANHLKVAEQTTITKITTTSTTTTTTTPTTTTTATSTMRPSTTTTVRTTLAVKSSQATTQFESTIVSRNSPTTSTSGLTKATQTLTTLPVNQRRTQGNLVGQNRFSSSSRFNEGSAFAGENWVLFNRPDGNFSAFEILVLVSNILIVSTIIFVILFTWLKSFRKKRQQQQQSSGMPSTVMSTTNTYNNNNNNNNNLELVASRQGKMSPISSGSELTTSKHISTTPSPTLASTTMRFEETKSLAEKQVASVMSRVEDKTKRMVAETDDNLKKQLVGSSQEIANEFHSRGANLANKAMAIVQPTENNNLTSKMDKGPANLNEPQQLPGKQAGISRSVSDLSANSRQPGVEKEKTSVDDMATGESQRVSKLENLFRDQKEAANGDTKSSKATKGAKRASLSSLESVELPTKLVDSIKKSGARNSDNTPSPNLLLGETEQTKTSTKQPPADNKRELIDKQTSEVDTKANEAAQAKTKVDVKREEKSEDVVVSTPERPENPMGKQMVDTAKAPQTNEPKAAQAKANNKAAQLKEADVKNHQVVVNKLDKRKTNLEIVDLRDESVAGKMRGEQAKEKGNKKGDVKKSAGNETMGPTMPGPGEHDDSSNWISMDGVAVVHSSKTGGVGQQQYGQTGPNQSPQSTPVTAAINPPGPVTAMSPSEIIESRFHVDYSSKRAPRAANSNQKDSIDSKQEEYNLNNIENELELDNKMRNRKYFVYIVNDGHFTAKKECIARIELPPKRRTTLAELRQLIANSQDISLVSLRRNRFKFVTETYRLLNENEDAAVLHQVYPTQGVFLKLNVAEQENQSYPYKGAGRLSGGARLSSGSGATGGVGGAMGGPGNSSSSTIASRRKATSRAGQATTHKADGSLPAIEVDYAGGNRRMLGQARASSVGRQRQRTTQSGGAFVRSKSSLQMNQNRKQQVAGRGQQAMRKGQSSNNLSEFSMGGDPLPSLGMSSSKTASAARDQSGGKQTTIQTLATDLGSNMISGAKKLLSSTFKI